MCPLPSNHFHRLRAALLVAFLVFSGAGALTTLRAQNFYSHGDPSPQEQLFLELVNRARANPPAEGARLGRAGEFAGYPVRPPMAFNDALLRAARDHNNDMEVNNFFSHSGSNGSLPGDRAAAAGYPGATISVGENLTFGYSTVQVAFDNLMLDDGVPGLEHRTNYLEFSKGGRFYRETGATLATSPRAMSTQVFSSRNVGFLTGVAFQDSNGDGFYTPGEGIGGVSVSSPQSSFVTTTSGSGGYALPLDNAPDLGAGVTVIFRDASGATYTRRMGLASTTGDGAPDNVKSDLRIGQDAPDAAATSTVSVVGTPSRGGFVLSRQGDDLSQALTVFYHNGGSAARDGDYVAFSGQATFSPGQGETIIAVQLLPGANRSKKVKVFIDPGAYQIGKAQSKVFLSDLP